jgi:hypothetical protein
VIEFELDTSELLEASKFVRGLTGAVNDPVVMIGGIRVYGQIAHSNYVQRGMVFSKRRWQGISNFTKKVREERGYSPVKPTSVRLANWPAFSPSISTTDSAYKGRQNDGHSTMIGRVMPRSAILQVTGPKAEHASESGIFQPLSGMTGEGRAGRFGAGYMPPRPFWGVTELMGRSLSQAMTGYLYMSWIGSVNVRKDRTKYKLDQSYVMVTGRRLSPWN